MGFDKDISTNIVSPTQRQTSKGAPPSPTGIGIDIGIKGGVGEKRPKEKNSRFDSTSGFDKTIPYLRNIRDQITFDEY